MLDNTQIPHLIKLLDDDSSDVRRDVTAQLASFGPLLKKEIQKLAVPLTSRQQEALRFIFDEKRQRWLKGVWPSWYSLKDEPRKLEAALSFLADFLTDLLPSGSLNERNLKRTKLPHLLDDLAWEYKVRFGSIEPKGLAVFLFREKGLQGNMRDYYNPQNSNLIYVIEKQKGIPISLAAVYILVGARLGLKIGGCPFPGHFLARVKEGGKEWLVDCFSSGQFVEPQAMLQLKGRNREEMRKALSEPSDTETILRRFLANLIRAFERWEDNRYARLLQGLLDDLEMHILEKNIKKATADQIIATIQPKFIPGQLVRHRHYGFRGIVVDFDLSCKSADQLYVELEIELQRHQPWFHILVDGTEEVRYVAQTNLLPDHSSQKIDHPLLKYFFIESANGQYIRNKNPWP